MLCTIFEEDKYFMLLQDITGWYLGMTIVKKILIMWIKLRNTVVRNCLRVRKCFQDPMHRDFHIRPHNNNNQFYLYCTPKLLLLILSKIIYYSCYPDKNYFAWFKQFNCCLKQVFFLLKTRIAQEYYFLF